MTTRNKQLKLLYKKYEHLEYPDLIRRAMLIEYDYNRRYIIKLRNEKYYENKKFYLSIKKELKKDIEDLKTITKYTSSDYLTFDSIWIIQSKVDALREIDKTIRQLDKQHDLYKRRIIWKLKLKN